MTFALALAGGGGLPARCLVDELIKLIPAKVAARSKKGKP